MACPDINTAFIVALLEPTGFSFVYMTTLLVVSATTAFQVWNPEFAQPGQNFRLFIYGG
jgi:hypothetical protein